MLPKSICAGSGVHGMGLHGMAVRVLTRGAGALHAAAWLIGMEGPIESTSLRSRSANDRGLYTPEDCPSQAAADVNAVDANESTVTGMERVDKSAGYSIPITVTV